MYAPLNFVQSETILSESNKTPHSRFWLPSEKDIFLLKSTKNILTTFCQWFFAVSNHRPFSLILSQFSFIFFYSAFFGSSSIVALAGLG
jgi:hypothetical protein